MTRRKRKMSNHKRVERIRVMVWMKRRIYNRIWKKKIENTKR